MDIKTFTLYLLLMAGSTYLIRVIPFVAVKNKITNKYIKSFLTYIPYAVLTAMTIPAIFYSTGYIVAACIGFAVAIVLSLRGHGLMTVAIAACVAVLVSELAISNLAPISNAATEDINPANYLTITDNRGEESIVIGDMNFDEDADDVDLVVGVDTKLTLSLTQSASDDADSELPTLKTTLSGLRVVNNIDAEGIYIDKSEDTEVVSASYVSSDTQGVITLRGLAVGHTNMYIRLKTSAEDIVFTVGLNINSDTTIELVTDDKTYLCAEDNIWTSGGAVSTGVPTIYLNSSKLSTNIRVEDKSISNSPITVTTTGDSYELDKSLFTAGSGTLHIQAVAKNGKLVTGRGTITFTAEANTEYGTHTRTATINIAVTDDELKLTSLEVKSASGESIGRSESVLSSIDREGKATIAGHITEVTDPIILSTKNKPSEKLTIITDVAPNYVRLFGADQQIVTTDSTGLIKSVSAGSTSVTITAGSDGTYLGSASIVIPVIVTDRVLTSTDPIVKSSDLTIPSYKISLAAGKSISAGAKSESTLSYSSDDEKVATVDSDGIITGVSEGVAIITVTSAETENMYAGTERITVIVTARAKKSSTIKLSATTLKYSALKKKSQKISVLISGSSGKVTVKNTSSKKLKKYIKISGKKIKFKKGAPKGTYTIKVTVAASENYKTATRTMRIKVK